MKKSTEIIIHNFLARHVGMYVHIPHTPSRNYRKWTEVVCGGIVGK